VYAVGEKKLTNRKQYRKEVNV